MTKKPQAWNVFDRRRPERPLGRVSAAGWTAAHVAALRAYPDVMASEVVVRPAAAGPAGKAVKA